MVLHHKLQGNYWSRCFCVGTIIQWLMHLFVDEECLSQTLKWRLNPSLKVCCYSSCFFIANKSFEMTWSNILVCDISSPSVTQSSIVGQNTSVSHTVALADIFLNYNEHKWCVPQTFSPNLMWIHPRLKISHIHARFPPVWAAERGCFIHFLNRYRWNYVKQLFFVYFFSNNQWAEGWEPQSRTVCHYWR